MAQALLEAGEYALLVANLGIDDPVGVEPRLSHCRGEEIAPGYAPQDLASCPGHDAGDEQRCRRTMNRTIAPAGDLVECAPSQAAAGQPCVDRLDAEGQNAMRDAADSLNLADPFTHGIEGNGRHG